MANKEKVIKELKEALDSLDITNKYRLNLIRAIEYLQEEHASDDLEDAFITGTKWQKEQMLANGIDGEILEMEDNDCAICSHTHLELCMELDTLEKNGFKDNDKVKVIIIKKD